MKHCSFTPPKSQFNDGIFYQVVKWFSRGLSGTLSGCIPPELARDGLQPLGKKFRCKIGIFGGVKEQFCIFNLVGDFNDSSFLLLDKWSFSCHWDSYHYFTSSNDHDRLTDVMTAAPPLHLIQ